MSGTFYDQLGGVAGVFEQWGACERTVVACALARRVPWPGLRLVQRAVEAALRQHSFESLAQDDERLERDANDEVLLASLITARADDDDDDGRRWLELLPNVLLARVASFFRCPSIIAVGCRLTVSLHPGSDRLHQLLTLLPLLRTDNERAKDVYVRGAPALVQRCINAPRRPTPSPAPELTRQLLSYLLVHPALTHNDQRTLTQWLRYLENHISGNRGIESVWQQRLDPTLVPENNIWLGNNTFRRTIGKNVEFRGIIDPLEASFGADLLQESFSKNGRDVEISLEGEKLNFDAAISQPKSQRSNSLTPPSTNFLHMSSSAENLSDEAFVQKPRSFSLSSEHSLSQLRPISIMYGTTGSETRLDDLRSNNFVEYPGMSTIAQWLKSLRLHKYVWLFTNISYEQMMAIDEKYLEKLGVTKGARHKILLSIRKLNEREAALASIEAELFGAPGGNVVRALDRLRAILLSPMPPNSPLPAGIVRALDLAWRSIGTTATAPAPRPPPAQTDDDLAPPIDPLSLHCWLVERALHHESFSSAELQEALKRLRHRLPPRQFFHHVCEMPLARRSLKPKWRTGPPTGYQKTPSRRWWSRPAQAPPAPRPKSNSYPPFPPALAPPRPQPSDDYSSLDALCLQMTEQAIN